ncbi:MAG: alpha-D-ribose 1-methylphosphonate 5-triphosphate diphosphatase [Salinarchaeum sp.]
MSSADRDVAATASNIRIENARIVTPEAVREGGVHIKAGRIAAIGTETDGTPDQHVDAEGQLVLPGLIDLHGDDIEDHVYPRSGVQVDSAVAFRSVDRANVTAGITTKFHAVSFTDRPEDDRSVELATRLADRIDRFNAGAIDHRFHARCELTNTDAVDAVVNALDRGVVDLASVMTHIPGQGQYRNFDNFKEWFAEQSSAPRPTARERWERTRSIDQATLDARADRVIDAAHAADIPVASHDNETATEIRRMADRGVDICEYPVTIAAAEAAATTEITTAMGAPNLVRGGSQRDNLATADAIDADTVDILLVDYHPPSLLRAAFVDTGEPLPRRVRRVTAAPADAVGLTDRGRIEPGARADLIVVDDQGPPTVHRAFVAGKETYRLRT